MARSTHAQDSAAPAVPEVPAHLEQALARGWQRYDRAFVRCRKKFSEGSVHQLRVETRRLLALLDLLESLASGEEVEAFRRVLRRFFKSFAQLRDTQVQLLFVEKHRTRFPEIAHFEAELARREKRLIRKLEKKVRRTGRKEIRRLVAALDVVLDAALAHAGLRTHGLAIVNRRVGSAFARVVALRRQVNPARPITIHRTRIAFKKFRYLVELLQPLLPGVSRPQLKHMHDHQTLMGEIQDLEVLQSTLDQFSKNEPEVSAALDRFWREIERQHGALITRYVARADRLLQFWPVAPGEARISRPTPRRKPRSQRKPGPSQVMTTSLPKTEIRP